MKTFRTTAVTLLVIAGALTLPACTQHAKTSGVNRHSGVKSTASGVTVTTVADDPIPNVPGKRLVSVQVDYAPGGYSASHRHAKSAFIHAYVVSGKIRSQVNDEPVRVYKAGEHWFEQPGSHHRISENASDTEPARLLAVFVVDATETALTTPDAK